MFRTFYWLKSCQFNQVFPVGQQLNFEFVTTLEQTSSLTEIFLQFTTGKIKESFLSFFGIRIGLHQTWNFQVYGIGSMRYF